MIDGFLNQTVALTPKGATKYDSWGQPSAGTPVTYAARAQGVQKRIQTDVNTFIDIRLEVWLPAIAAVENDDKIVFGSTSYKVVQVDRQYDIDGTLDHIKVLCR